jgi:hypothetical protein
MLHTIQCQDPIRPVIQATKSCPTVINLTVGFQVIHHILHTIPGMACRTRPRSTQVTGVRLARFHQATLRWRRSCLQLRNR